MLQRIKNFFDANVLDEGIDDAHEQRLKLATAALLTEVMFIDGHDSDEEQAAIRRLLENHYALSAEQSRELVELAEEEVRTATSMYQFTALVDKHFSHREKERLMLSLWELAYADEVLDKYEEATIRKIADLIHVSHTTFIQAKHRAEGKT